MKNTDGFRFCSWLVFLILAAQLCVGQEVQLEYKFKKGSVQKYKQNLKQQLVSDAIRRGQLEINIEFVETLTVDSVYADGSADCILVDDNMITRINQEKVPNPDLEEMSGVPVVVRISRTGQYLDVRGGEDLSSKQKKRVESLKKQYQTVKGFPANPVQVGDTWSDETALSVDIPGGRVDQIMNRKFTLVGFEKYEGINCAVIRISGTINGTQTGEEFEATFNGTMRGTQFFDYKETVLMRSFLDQQATSMIESRKGPKELKINVGFRIELLK